MAEFSLELLPHIPRKVKRQAVTWNRTQDTWLLQPVLCHWATTAGQQPALTILYTVCRLVRLVLQLTVCLRETKTTLCMVSPLSMHSCVIFVKNTSYTFLTLSFLQTKGKAFQEQVNKLQLGHVLLRPCTHAQYVTSGGQVYTLCPNPTQQARWVWAWDNWSLEGTGCGYTKLLFQFCEPPPQIAGLLIFYASW